MAFPDDYIPERILKAEEFRNSLLRREANAIRFLEARWRVSMTGLQNDIDKMTAKIEKAREKGERVNRDWLRRQREYKRLQAQIVSETNKYSREAAARLAKETEYAAFKGASDFTELTLMSFDTNVRELVSFGRLDDETVKSIAARVNPRSPAGKLLGKMGRQTATAARNVLVDGITRGRNVRVIASDLTKVAGLPAKRAKTIARTEIFGAYVDSAHEYMASSNVVESWIWHCQLETACGGCLANHGKEFPVGTYMKRHPNCHCEPIPKPKSFTDLGLPASLDRQFPDPMQPDRMVAQAEQQIRGASLDELQRRFGQGKGELLFTGKVELEQLSTVVENKIWGGATIETPLKNLV